MLRVAIALNTPNLLAENYFSQVESILLSFITNRLEKDNRLRLSTVKKIHCSFYKFCLPT